MNQRPTGVTILAILAFIGGILSILGGLTLVGLGGVGLGGLAILFGIYALVWGALALWIGWGFWQLRPSAWRWGIILMVIGAVIAIIQIPLGYSELVSAAISVAIDLAVIYYLTTPAVRAAFGQSTSGGMMDAVMGAFGMGGGGSAAAASVPPPAMGEPPAMSPPPAERPPEPPAMSPPPASSWGSTTGTSTGGETSSGGERADRDEDEKL